MERLKLESLNTVPTLEEVPNEGVVSFTDEAGEHRFLVGDLARVADADSEQGYTFYQLYNITPGGKAVWGKTGGGGSADLREEVTIRLISNLSTADAALVGAGVTVTDADGMELYAGTWQGADIKLLLPPAAECTVAAGGLMGYRTPEAQRFTTVVQGMRTLTFAYSTCEVTVRIDCNQPDKSDLEGVKIRVTYDETAMALSGGEKVKVPTGSSVDLSAPVLDGYFIAHTPVFTPTEEDTHKEFEFMYLTEVVEVTATADNGADMSDVYLEVTSADSDQTEFYGSGHGTMRAKVPFRGAYRVTASDKPGYVTPEAQEFLPNQVSRRVEMRFVEQRYYVSTIRIDQTITDPATMITGDVNGEAIKQIRAHSHRYAGKYTDEGTMTICQLDDTDSSQFADGEAPMSGDEDVFMRLPEFHYKAMEVRTDVWDISFAYGKKPDDKYKTWDNRNLIGVYEASKDGERIYSRSGRASAANIGQFDFKAYARSRGKGYTLVTWEQHCIMAFLYYAMYGHTNCQEKVGYGTYDYDKETGQTDSFGMKDTVGGGSGDVRSINFWGLENWWGNKYEFIGNVHVFNNTLFITENDGTTRFASVYSLSGYISKIAIGEYLDVIATEVYATDTTGYCDHYYLNSIDFFVLTRSYDESRPDGGVACIDASHDDSYDRINFGSRLSFFGEIIEQPSSLLFRRISAIN